MSPCGGPCWCATFRRPSPCGPSLFFWPSHTRWWREVSARRGERRAAARARVEAARVNPWPARRPTMPRSRSLSRQQRAVAGKARGRTGHVAGQQHEPTWTRPSISHQVCPACMPISVSTTTLGASSWTKARRDWREPHPLSAPFSVDWWSPVRALQPTARQRPFIKARARLPLCAP